VSVHITDSYLDPLGGEPSMRLNWLNSEFFICQARWNPFKTRSKDANR
jgi:hypothetical protein